jgi:hypothetical protein
MPNHSDSVDNLKNFIAIVLDPNEEKIEKANPELDNHAEVLDQLDDEVVGTGNMFDQAVESVGTDIGADVDMAIEAIGELEKAAQTGTSEDLQEMGSKLDAGAEAFVKAAGEVEKELDQAGTDLASGGFEDAVGDLEAATEALEAAVTPMTSAFDNLEKDLGSQATQLSSSLGGAAGSAGGAAGELNGHTQAIEAEGQAAVQAVSSACDATASTYEAMQGTFDGFYQTVTGTINEEGNSFIECVRKLLEAQNEQAREKEVEPLSGPMDIVIDDVLQPHRAELNKWEETVRNAAEAAEDLKKLASDLKRSKAAADEITELGEAMKGGG